MYPPEHMWVRPVAYWMAVFSRERREERARIAQEAARASSPQPIRYSAISPTVAVISGLKRGKLPPLSAPYRTRLMEAQGGRCYLCGKHMSAPTEDHVVPKALGGKNRANRLMACGPCNNRKANRPPRPCEVIYLQAINLRAFHRARPVERHPPALAAE